MTQHIPQPQSELPHGFDVLASIRRLIAQDNRHIQHDRKAPLAPVAPFARVRTPDEDEAEPIDPEPIDTGEPRLLLDRTDLIERIRLSPRLHLGEAKEDGLQTLPVEHVEAEARDEPLLAEQDDPADEICGTIAALTLPDMGHMDACECGSDLGTHDGQPAAAEALASTTELPICDLAQGDFGLGAEQEELPPAPESRSVSVPPAPPVAAAATQQTPLQSDRSQAIARAIARPSINRPAQKQANAVRRDFDDDMNLHLFAPTDSDLPNGSVLRNLIREVIRQELHGEMGGRFSRNLRTVIRQEVAAALELQAMPRVDDIRHDGLQQ